MDKIILNVEGMTCGHCENRVKKAVGGLAGVSDVDVSLTEKTVAVTLAEGSGVTDAQIRQVIEDQGYTVV